MVPSFNLAQFDTICIVCAHTPLWFFFFAIIAIPPWDTFTGDSLQLRYLLNLPSFKHVYTSSATSLCEIAGEAGHLCYQTRLTLFSSEPQCLCLSVSLSTLFFCVFPFSFPEGGVAFTASNYRLYQSYISPYISVDLSSHLKGQLIALWQACVRPLKEKSRSGWSNSPPFNTYTSKHLHVLICFWSFFFHMHFISFL